MRIETASGKFVSLPVSKEGGTTLLELLRKAEIAVESPCSGKGTCGKCKVRFMQGVIPEATITEKLRLTEEEIASGIRLSCEVSALVLSPDSEILLLNKGKNDRVLTGGYMPSFTQAPGLRKVPVKITKPTLSDQTPFEDQILLQTGAASLASELLQSAVFQEESLQAVVFNDQVIAVEADSENTGLFGIALDIGTTTVVCSLIDVRDGREIANASMINAQKVFGLDVLSRISYEVEHPDSGIRSLQEKIAGSVMDMIREVCNKGKISASDIYEMTVAANSTMMHMFLGIDATPIGKAPYAPMFVKSRVVSARSLGLSLGKGAFVYCLPSVSAYIGADIVAGSYVCELHKKEGSALFIDIGTNGEIVLAHKGKLLSCSCAAGPALEGMNISCGMRAADGAIEDVKISEQGVLLTLIGEKAEKPEGICGSGILAVVKELVRTGLIAGSGTFIKKEKLDPSDYRYDMIALNGKKREFILDAAEKLVITQGDIRQVQLAKGAILSGFLALLKKAGIGMEDLDQVMIAGQFGAHLPADSLTGTGILPAAVEDRLVYVGNSSRTGAYMALMSEKVKREMEELASHMDYMELSAVEGYERLFTECTLFSV